ncbi:30S ribosomal protein S4 [Oligoflexus tunisiensis]|uniref:30S ribosomal protein S4 n=1 Tax=Oligoflexus tunisiensis TaxID=708132 RepID=UPI000A598475|nr:30S ribosomal protein S4 [Oligoflexus tunisiensis]
MARFKGPRLKIMRSLGVQLPGLSRKKWDERKAYPPGMHQGRHRKKVSVYGTQLREKQKLRFNYGLGEKQLRRFVDMSFQMRGNPGENLLQFLERRLDNFVFRAGFASTIPAARQLIVHGHIKVDGKRVNKPSFLMKKGHKVSLHEKAAKFNHVQASLEQLALVRPEWIGFDEGNKDATVVSLPNRDSVPFPIEIGQVIEFYSK